MAAYNKGIGKMRADSHIFRHPSTNLRLWGWTVQL